MARRGSRSRGGMPSDWRKPRISLFIATACGLGYIPMAPGTFGSLAGVWVLALLPFPRVL